MSVRRTTLHAAALIVSATILVLGGAPATAGVVAGGGKPSPREFLDSGLPVTFASGTACDFDVTLTEVANNEYIQVFPNGNALITGQLVIRITNDATGASVVRNISGPVLITTGPNGEAVVVLNGSSLSPVFEGFDATGVVGTGLFVFNGPTVFVNGQLTRVSGSYEDLCATLAG